MSTVIHADSVSNRPILHTAQEEAYRARVYPLYCKCDIGVHASMQPYGLGRNGTHLPYCLGHTVNRQGISVRWATLTHVEYCTNCGAVLACQTGSARRSSGCIFVFAGYTPIATTTVVSCVSRVALTITRLCGVRV